MFFRFCSTMEEMKVSKSGWIPCFKRPSFVLNPGSKDFIAFPLAYCINALHNFFFVRIFLITSGLLMYLTITMLLLSDIICWNRSQTALKKVSRFICEGDGREIFCWKTPHPWDFVLQDSPTPGEVPQFAGLILQSLCLAWGSTPRRSQWDVH